MLFFDYFVLEVGELPVCRGEVGGDREAEGEGQEEGGQECQ